MSKYTIEVIQKDLKGYEYTTTLFDLSYLELLETYALINALEFHEVKIMLHTKVNGKQLTSIEDFIINKSTEKMIYDLSRN